MPGTNLTRDEAAARSALIQTESYDVALDLTRGAETFGTRTIVRFTCASPGEDTWIDFVGASVERVELNGTELDPATAWVDSRIALPGLAESNELTVEATGTYMNTGEGLHRFVDPADGEVYLYTQFEVPDSRRMYAAFEQPDLKATFAFTVTAPEHWQVISNEPTPEPTPAGEGADGPSATWSFPATPPISSYITALVAGPYDVVRDSVSTRAGEIPLGVFCRRSLTPHLDAENILDVTKKGFAFFEEEFDRAYPFTKYDQIFTPEYNMGAMENAGCVTIVENYVFRSKVTEAVVERRALTILHELAHMWFGDLVTMTWWDDLWLNESFAEWASTTAQAEATEWKDAWTTFGTAEKAWAYKQDQLSSTHPVAADMVDLAAVEVNFDGITYAKGASVLKQLVAYVGREPFRDGLRAYFAKHAWGNTTLRDLLAELEATSGRDLTSWSEVWLETAGVNTLTPEVEVADDGTITALEIVQTTPEEHPTQRPHRLAVGCYDLVEGVLRRTHRVELDVDGERTEVTDLAGRPMPDLLLVNDDDLAYAKVRLDGRSLATALEHVRRIEDSLARALVLGAAWDMTRDGEMSASDYVRLVLTALPGETDSTLLRVLIQQVSAAALTYTAPGHRQAVVAELTAGLRAATLQAEGGSDAQLQLVTAWASFAQAEEDLVLVHALLDGERELAGLTIDQDMRWTLLTALATAGAVGEEEIAAERQRDNTATGHEKAARARAAQPSPEAKDKAWVDAVETAGLSNSVLAAMALGFGRVHDEALLEPYVERYHAVIDRVWQERTHHIAESLAVGFYPLALASPQLLEASQTWLAEHPEASNSLRRTVAENRDAVARAVAAQEADAG
ncbi:Membrane alanine aminopeptidase N [Serinicoccus hydrothermalis]|uniref:Aminopeptidase N n=1 Tax=Serinicoccus hydrothermalis TaxID=1758689 RepID=A0A1B1NAR1_9MICO|nr:aminopeptidase N [Serinicoccus hydrothermalis]ANS78518.1 Membrane alanine aminopeptidase N [Serinicoccus hydrothermalis]